MNSRRRMCPRCIANYSSLCALAMCGKDTQPASDADQPDVRFGSWLCENSRARHARRSTSPNCALRESNHTAHGQFAAALENCIFYILPMYEFLHSQGQKATWQPILSMSALPPTTDIRRKAWNVGLCYKRTLTALFNDLIGARPSEVIGKVRPSPLADLRLIASWSAVAPEGRPASQGFRSVAKNSVHIPCTQLTERCPDALRLAFAEQPRSRCSVTEGSWQYNDGSRRARTNF